MKTPYLIIVSLILVLFLPGCIKTYTYQAERKDQDLVGNRGIVKGEVPPPLTGIKRTRTMGAMDIELPPKKAYKAKKKALQEAPTPEKPAVKVTKKVTAEVAVKEEGLEKEKGFADEQWVAKKEVKEEKMITPPAVELQPKEVIPQEVKYTIQEGDTLEKIAKKFLGKASKWPEIYEANKDILKDPSKIFPGQVIVIPQGEIVEEKTEKEIK